MLDIKRLVRGGVAVVWLVSGSLAGADEYTHLRSELVEEIHESVERTSRFIGRDTFDPRVLEAIGRVPRHEFVSLRYRDQAYENHPLPIGHGQTISQPYIVALMTELVAPDADDRVLEIGTGSGYQAAVMAELVDTVYSMEIIPPLAERARKTLTRLGYRNVHTRIGDGYYGWQQQAPFDAILVTAAAGHVPPPLLQQLKPGGRMVIPVGSRFMTQQLVLIEKDRDGNITAQQLLPVRFVPLTGEHD